MLKKISLLTIAFLALSLLASCHSRSKSEEIAAEVVVEDKSKEVPSTYQTVDDAKQAEVINQQPQVQEIEVQDRVLFGYDSSEVSDDAKKILDIQVDWLKSDAAIKVTIEGHCDERGTREYNIALGEKRANVVKNYLIAGGISESRLKVVSYGKERPAFFGEGEEVKSKNRRAVTVMN